MKLMILLLTLCSSLSAYAGIEFQSSQIPVQSVLLTKVSHPASFTGLSFTGQPRRRNVILLKSRDGSSELLLSLQDRASQTNPDLYSLPLYDPAAVLHVNGQASEVTLNELEISNFSAYASAIESKVDNCGLQVHFHSGNMKILGVELICNLPDSYLR